MATYVYETIPANAAETPRRFEVQHLRPVNRSAAPPELWLIWRGLK